MPEIEDDINEEALLEILPDIQPAMMFQLVLGEGGLVIAMVTSNALQEGAVEVSEEVYNQARSFAHGARFVDGELEALPAPAPVQAQRRVTTVAMGELAVLEGGEVTGLELSVNLAAAMAIDLNVFWVFFSFEQDAPDYIAMVQAPGCYVDVTDRQPDYFEVTVFDRATYEPKAPSSLSITVQKVVQ